MHGMRRAPGASVGRRGMGKGRRSGGERSDRRSRSSSMGGGAISAPCAEIWRAVRNHVVEARLCQVAGRAAAAACHLRVEARCALWLMQLGRTLR